MDCNELVARNMQANIKVRVRMYCVYVGIFLQLKFLKQKILIPVRVAQHSEPSRTCYAGSSFP